MNNQLIITLKQKLDEENMGEGLIGMEAQKNILKEELQFYVLNFIYHHSKYSNWTMYGGSALRICHGLNRMSVDLDFEIENVVSEEFLEDLSNEIKLYFLDAYKINSEFLAIKKTNNRGLRLNFHIGDTLNMAHPSKQVHVKIDLNFFNVQNVVFERIPINRGQFSFVIKTYNMSSLMASKIAAVLSRGKRGVGKEVYEEKGRDIYDLLWYMNKKIIPDLDYLAAKGIDIKDLRALFDKLTLQMNKVSDKNLKQDLTILFVNQTFINDWLKNWRETYFKLLESYEIHIVVDFKNIRIYQDFDSNIFSFIYSYSTEDSVDVEIIYKVSDYWIKFQEGELSIDINKKIDKMIEFGEIKRRVAKQDKLKQYASLFYKKSEDYFKKTNRIMLGEVIETKIIRMTANNLNQKKEIVLNKSALISCGLEELLA